jgi:hypothetical protein
MRRSAPFRRPAPKVPAGKLGPCLHRGVAYSKGGMPGGRYVITEEYVSGYVIVSRHRTRSEALRALAALNQEGKR